MYAFSESFGLSIYNLTINFTYIATSFSILSIYGKAALN